MDKQNYRLILEYDGSAFNGFQRLGQEEEPTTVQGVLELALSRLMDEPVSLSCAGRTDAGVHALGQVISFKTFKRRPVERVLAGANALLPETVRVLEAHLAPERFHARFSASWRSYRYLLCCPDRPDCFWPKRLCSVPRPLNVEAMNRAAALLLGEHDFSSYGAQVPKGISRVRTLWELQVEACSLSDPANLGGDLFGRLGQCYAVRVRANGFLRRMVRMLTASLVQVGLNKMPVEGPKLILDLRDPRACPPPLAPYGLYFEHAEYPAELL